MAQPSIQGRFVWQELISSEMTVAEKFYANLIGWRLQTPMHDGAPYTVFSAQGGPVAGVMPLSEEARALGAGPHWLPYMGAENIDATLTQAEKLGAKVLRAAADVEGVGRYAVLADPQGAAFGIYRPERPHIPPGRPQRGEFAWQELATSDYEAAFSFYSALFGWQMLRRMDMGPAGTYLIFGRDKLAQGGIYKIAAQTPAPYWLPYIEVESADGVAAGTRQAGGQLVSGPMDVPGGRIAHLLDPGGVLFAVHTLLGPTEVRPAAARRPAARKAATKVAAKSSRKSTRKTARKAPKKAGKARRPAARKTAGKAARKVASSVRGKARRSRASRGRGRAGSR